MKITSSFKEQRHVQKTLVIYSDFTLQTFTVDVTSTEMIQTIPNS